LKIGGEILFERIESSVGACFISFTREGKKASRMPDIDAQKMKEEDSK